MDAENQYFAKKKQKIHFFSKSTVFLKKINPYRTIPRDDEGNLMEPSFWVRYNSIMQWLIDLHLNGFICTFLFSFWFSMPIGYIPILGFGMTIFFISRVLEKVWNAYVEGKLRIERYRK